MNIRKYEVIKLAAEARKLRSATTRAGRSVSAALEDTQSLLGSAVEAESALDDCVSLLAQVRRDGWEHAELPLWKRIWVEIKR